MRKNVIETHTEGHSTGYPTGAPQGCLHHQKQGIVDTLSQSRAA